MSIDVRTGVDTIWVLLYGWGNERMRLDMKENVGNLTQEIRGAGHPMLADRVSRLVIQERASAHIEACLEEKTPHLEALSDTLEYEMADMLQQYFDDGTLDPEGPVKANRKTLKLIARHAAIKFQKLAAQ